MKEDTRGHRDKCHRAVTYVLGEGWKMETLRFPRDDYTAVKKKTKYYKSPSLYTLKTPKLGSVRRITIPVDILFYVLISLISPIEVINRDYVSRGPSQEVDADPPKITLGHPTCHCAKDPTS